MYPLSGGFGGQRDTTASAYRRQVAGAVPTALCAGRAPYYQT